MQAFPKGSALAIDISRAILKAIESEEVQKLEEEMLSNTNCGSSNRKIKDEQLGPQPFFGLFGICGTIATFGLSVSVIHFVRRKPQIFMSYIEGALLRRARLRVIVLIARNHINKCIRSAPVPEAYDLRNTSAENEQSTVSIELPINHHS